MKSLRIRYYSGHDFPYLVETSHGVTLARFKSKPQAESYCKSRLLELAFELQITSDRRDASEEETLP